MVEADERIAAGAHAPARRRLLDFVLRPAPDRFTPANFLARTGQHAVVYMTVTIAAMCACALTFIRL